MAHEHITQSRRKPRLAVWKFASCDGCRLSLLNCEDQLLAIPDHVEIAYFPEASSLMGTPPYDLSLVEGAISTPEDEKRIREVRRMSKVLAAIGACATAGGIQALRNFSGGEAFASMVYPQPGLIEMLPSCTPVSSHVTVDFELRGCPVSKSQLLETLTGWLHGRKPDIPRTSVCIECKRERTICIMVARRVPCLGPVTQSGCGALCPRFGRGCYGCFGPKETPNVTSLRSLMEDLGVDRDEIRRAFRAFNAYAEGFREEG